MVTAENGLQALQFVSSNPPGYFDAIILDINMPIMDGFEACLMIDQDLRGRWSKLVSPCEKPLIYALTADELQGTHDLIGKYPFSRRFNTLAVEEEIQIIRQDIADNVRKPEISINV